jgi:predicted KAP-like P-loop ATPase
MTDVAQAGTAGVTDNPITRATDDLLQRGDVAAALAENLRYVDAWKGHVVGVLGPWGSGKTSLVYLIRERLAITPELPVLDWGFLTSGPATLT